MRQQISWASLTMLCLCSMLVSSATNAQEKVLKQYYGNGVHAYYSRDYMTAYELLSKPIEAKIEDPRPYYFRGFALMEMGRPDQAYKDFQSGAQWEMKDTAGRFPVNYALERCQGMSRLALEEVRAEVQLAAFQKRVKYGAAIYGANSSMGADVALPGTNGSDLLLDANSSLDIEDGSNDTEMKDEPANDADNLFGNDEPAVTAEPATDEPAVTAEPETDEPTTDEPATDEPAVTAEPETDEPTNADSKDNADPFSTETEDEAKDANPLDNADLDSETDDNTVTAKPKGDANNNADDADPFGDVADDKKADDAEDKKADDVEDKKAVAEDDPFGDGADDEAPVDDNKADDKKADDADADADDEAPADDNKADDKKADDADADADDEAPVDDNKADDKKADDADADADADDEVPVDDKKADDKKADDKKADDKKADDKKADDKKADDAEEDPFDF